MTKTTDSCRWVADEAPTIAQCLALTCELSDMSDSARIDVEVLLAKTLDTSRTYLFTWPEKMLSSAQWQVFTQMLARRKAGEPVAYITGEKEFWSHRFCVDASTLIPRPDTETLVEAALAFLSPDKNTLLDLGTGSGAIAISLALELPFLEVTAVDFSESALALAQKNVQRLRASNVSLLHSNWFADVVGRFNVIVGNPPYIDANDHHLQSGDVVFEPRSALVADDQGLADIKRITSASRQFLCAGGYLLLEHGCTQGAVVRDIFVKRGFADVITRQDLSGHDRVTLGCWHG